MKNMSVSINERAFSNLTLVAQLDEVLRGYNVLLDGGCEKEFLQFARHFEDCRKKWAFAETRVVDLSEKLTKSEAEKNALLIKLKHARRQIEVEMQGRHQAEQDRDEMDQQLMLVRELLFNENTPTTTLSEEQQKKLDFLNASRFQSPRNGARSVQRKLGRIDETADSMLSDYSDISFDRTEDDLDGSNLRNGKKWKRGRAARRAFADQEEILSKRSRTDIPDVRGYPQNSDSYHNALEDDCYHLGANESLRCTVDGPAVMCIEKLEKSFNRPNPHQGRRRPSREHRRKSATATSESETQSEVEHFWPNIPTTHPLIQTPTRQQGKRHNLQTKPCVITKENCKPCGKRINFGKKALKCTDCRMIAHPQCENDAKTFPCEPNSPSASTKEKTTIRDFLASEESPMIPPIIYHTVQEIERRGLDEAGLYRVPGMLRLVKELREKFKGKTVPKLTEVTDIHALCSLVKDFLRETIKEPILTFALRNAFIEAAHKEDDSLLYQALNDLEEPNRDTLMFLMLHFQRVVETPASRMTVEGLSKAVGPSIVGFAGEPSLSDMQSETGNQEIVVTRLLQLPSDYYARNLANVAKNNAGRTPQRGNAAVSSTPEIYNRSDSLFGPLESPQKTPSGTSMAERAKKYLGGTPFGRGKQRKESYFASPSLN